MSPKAAPTSVATVRHSRDVASTLALSTLMTRPLRPRASSKASRTMRSISRSWYGIVSCALRSPISPEASRRLPK
jgi:hypothetical protein